MSEVRLVSKFWWKLCEPVAGVHLHTPVSAALLIRWLECSIVGGAVESDQLVESVTHPLKGSLAAVHDAVGSTSLPSGRAATTEKLLGDFSDPVKDVCQSAAQLARGVVLGSWRCLDVGVGTAGQGEDGNDQDQLSH